MRKVVSLLTSAFLGSAVNANKGDQLHFVQEVVRHGARAPTADTSGFKVSYGELTAQGMRQRFLLGTLNRQRYVDQYELISDLDWANQVYVQTTLYDRTFQSGYSELMGFFPPGSLTDQ
jgi:hypothetical protein